MPGLTRPIASERDGLLTFLEQQRDAARTAAFGLTEEQAWSRPSASSLSVAGLIKHLARTERRWIVAVLAERELPDLWPVDGGVAAFFQAFGEDFQRQDGDTLAGVLELYAEVAKETESIIAEIDDLSYTVPIPQVLPFFPKSGEWSARWVLLHVIEETARHAGHADVIRESLDGMDARSLEAQAAA